ncbi:phenylalanine 4-monooxygenase [Streptomyces sp. WMMC500]|uniref:phenylalanine 4-monooxygenase n=1 Tax=Streptomyces sp. WMMC500 TaxID=3015154 RepID=UPI00248B2573|nr:phenylalanine 4-monooxygenase [Streptomyces sp. WMMC500]WBB62006.1 phenylalanine 4-monooxygenase [Streptomyces sp. WMMC500]
MFEDGQKDTSVRTNDEGAPVVHLDPELPGSGDPHYLGRRNEILKAALSHMPGDPAPEVSYAPDDHECWRTIRKELHTRHRTYACAAMNEAGELLDLPYDHVPQLRTVSERLSALTGFRFAPAAGIVPVAEFYGPLAEGTFLATQFIRHSSKPLFSPEPDMVHEVIGHGTALASSRIADLYRLLGRTIRHLETDGARQAVSRFFWFTMEYGVIKESGEMKAFGASLLSSCGELAEFRGAEIRSMNVGEMITIDYDYSRFQPILFHADSISHFEDFFSDFCVSATDESVMREISSR